MNEANTPLSKVASFFKGVTNDEITLSEGYLAKHQKKASKKLETFYQDLTNKIVSLPRLFQDDRVCKFGIETPSEGFNEEDLDILEMTNENNQKYKNGVIRFYGDDNWALLISHKNKKEEGVKQDGILTVLPKTCIVMHDHLLLNYNPDFNFINAECNEHTKRYLKRNMEIMPSPTQANKMQELFIQTNADKQKIIVNKPEASRFTEEKLKEISDSYDSIIQLAYSENDSCTLNHIQDKLDELKLIKRPEKFKVNHLLFAYDFTVAFTNNTSERSLRQFKRKLAVSFSFKNINHMKDYAMILSYIETCYHNSITRYQSFQRFLDDNPYTVEEIKKIITIESEKK